MQYTGVDPDSVFVPPCLKTIAPGDENKEGSFLLRLFNHMFEKSTRTPLPDSVNALFAIYRAFLFIYLIIVVSARLIYSCVATPSLQMRQCCMVQLPADYLLRKGVSMN